MSGPVPARVRIKVYSKNGQHRVTVVGDDGFEADLAGCSHVQLHISAGDKAVLALAFVEFEPLDVKGLR